MPLIPKPDPKQALVLFSLLFTGDEPMISKLKPQLTPKARNSLVKAGLIELDRRGKAQHVVLTEAGWDWAGKNLDARISKQARANETLIAVLLHLKAFLGARGIALGEMVRAGTVSTLGPRAQEASRSNPQTDIATRVREVCLRAAEGRTGVRVRLADLRAALPDVTRAALDQTLLAMQRSGVAVFFPLDNPQERFPADEHDALNIAGIRHHVMYLDG